MWSIINRCCCHENSTKTGAKHQNYPRLVFSRWPWFSSTHGSWCCGQSGLSHVIGRFWNLKQILNLECLWVERGTHMAPCPMIWNISNIFFNLLLQDDNLFIDFEKRTKVEPHLGLHSDCKHTGRLLPKRTKHAIFVSRKISPRTKLY